MARLAIVEAEDRIEIDVDARGLDGAGNLGEQAAVVAMILRGVVCHVVEIGLRPAQCRRDMAQRANLAVDGIELMG